MTEPGWLTSTDPSAMLHCLVAQSVPGNIDGTLNPLSDRKLRLWACACVRQVWHLLTDERSRQAVEVIERKADGEAQDEEIDWDQLHDAIYQLGWNRAIDTAQGASERCLAMWDGDQADPGRRQTVLLRDIAGNPYRPVPPLRAYDLGRGCPWLTPTVLTLARAAYAERPGCPCPAIGCNSHAQSRGVITWADGKRIGSWQCAACHGTGRIADGALDPLRLLVLADALEEAGCVDLAILDHLRSPGVHVRGCWVIDHLLGKD